nr:ANTAR domain-containing protein [Acidobacteriota bacterium]
EDLDPIRQCIRSILAGEFDVVLFMTAIQIIHLFQVAEQMAAEGVTPARLRAALNAMVLVSIGPTTTEEMEQYGIKPDFEPSQSKMGFLVNEAAQYAGKILQQKRTAATDPEPSEPATSHQVPRVAASTTTMAGFRDALAPIDFLHEISSSLAAEPDSLHLVLERIVAFVTTVIPCDSCFLYVLEGQKDGQKLVLRASKNPHADVVDQLGVLMGQGITGWVAEHREPVALASNASNDPRFKAFKNLPEDHFEAMLSTPILCASKVIGVINLQHRLEYQHTSHEVRLLSMLGFLVGAEIERARLETENQLLANRLETRKLLDRAKGILQRDLGVHEDEAYRRMQSESRQRRKSMREIAEAILLADDLRKSTQPPK